MNRNIRIALLGSVTSAAIFASSSPAAAQSTCSLTTPGSTFTIDCTSPNGNGSAVGVSPVNSSTEFVTDVLGLYGGDLQSLTTTGYFETTTAGRDGIVLSTSEPLLTYVGTNSTIVGSAAATGVTLLDINAASIVANTGTIQADGAGSTGVLLTSTGGAGSGGIDATIDGDVSVMGNGVIVNQSNVAADGDVNVTLLSGESVLANGGNAITATSVGAGNVTVTNNGAIGSYGTANTLLGGINATSSGIGDVTVDGTGSIGSSTDRAATGVNAEITNAASDGDVTVDLSGSGATWTSGNAITAQTAGTGDATVMTGGAIDTDSGNAITAVTTTGNTMVTANGAINAGGLGIDAVSAGGDVTVNNAAALTAAGTGIYASTTGAGDITVTRTGASNLSSTGGVGILATGGTGTTTISTGTGTVSGATTGIQAASTGTQSITANGNVTGVSGAGIHSDTTANRVITVATGRTVTGGAEAILLTNTGTATINNNGTIGTAGGVAIQGSAAGATTINNNAGATMNGSFVLGAGNDVLTNAGTINAQGTLDFGGGADTLTNAAAGTFNLAAATTLANLETFTNAGRINLNTFALTGTGAFTNTGTIDTNGTAGLTGFTSLSNAGTLDLAAGTFTAPTGPFTNTGTIIADEGATTITGQTSFTNAATGVIDLQDGAIGDVLTINSSYTGTAGSRLQIDASDTLADRLVVTGAISGSTAVDANLLGTGAIIDTDLLVVDGQSTSTANAFVLGNLTGNASPLVNYGITQVGSDYFLSSALSAAAFDPLVVSSLIPQLWYPSADEIFANLAVPYKGEGVGFWGQGYYGRDKFGESDDTVTIAGTDYTINDRVKHSRFGLQAGVDFGMGDTGRVGVTAGYGWHKLRGATDLDANGWNIGAYGAFGGPTGFHGEALIKHDRYKPDFDGGAFDGYGSKIRSTGIDGAVGYRIPMGGENSSFDLAAGVSHVWTKVDDLEAYGIRYSFDDFDSTRGRASARYNFGGDVQPYVSGTIYHEFADGGTVALFDGVDTYDLDSRARGTWGRIEGGIGGSPNRFPTFAAWVDLGDMKGIGARLGMRFGGTSEAAPPPPPPPPPAPVEVAPATQTCYDGSVILATDTCPVPPPPPPPPPAPERG